MRSEGRASELLQVLSTAPSESLAQDCELDCPKKQPTEYIGFSYSTLTSAADTLSLSNAGQPVQGIPCCRIDACAWKGYATKAPTYAQVMFRGCPMFMIRFSKTKRGPSSFTKHCTPLSFVWQNDLNVLTALCPPATASSGLMPVGAVETQRASVVQKEPVEFCQERCKHHANMPASKHFRRSGPFHQVAQQSRYLQQQRF